MAESTDNDLACPRCVFMLSVAGERSGRHCDGQKSCCTASFNPAALTQVEYARELFDYYAQTYDDHMRKKLLYTGPRLLRQVCLNAAVGSTLRRAPFPANAAPSGRAFVSRAVSCVGVHWGSTRAHDVQHFRV